MGRSMDKMKSNLLLVVLLLYFSNVFISNGYSNILLSILAFVLLLASFPAAKSITKVMGVSLLGVGLVISLTMNNANLLESIQGIQLNLPLLVLMLMAPLLSIPLKSGPYLDAPIAYIEQVKNQPKKLFIGISGFLALLTPILNVGSVRILDELMRNRKLPDELLGRSYFTGFSTAMVWSPYFGSVALVLYYLDISYSEYFFIGMLFACTQLLTGNLLFAFRNRKENFGSLASGQNGGEEITILPLVIKFVAVLGTLIAALVFLEYLTQLSMLVLVSLLAMIIPSIWMYTAGKWKEFVYQAAVYKNYVATGMSTEIVLFLSAGIFGSAISNSTISVWIGNRLLQISDASLFVFVLFIVSTIMFFAFIGFHQIITIPILVMQIDPAVMGIHPVVLAFIFIMAWFMSAIVSPINAITILITNALSRRFFTIAFHWNGVYVLSMFLIGSVFIYMLQMIYR